MFLDFFSKGMKKGKELSNLRNQRNVGLNVILNLIAKNSHRRFLLLKKIYDYLEFILLKNLFKLILSQMNEVTAFNIIYNKQEQFKNIHAQEYSYRYSPYKSYLKIMIVNKNLTPFLRFYEYNFPQFEILENLFFAIEKNSKFQGSYVFDSWLFIYFHVTEFSDFWGKLAKNSSAVINSASFNARKNFMFICN